ncbi:MAG: DUF6265 family protein [Alphaproteobacteria bacterium]
MRNISFAAALFVLLLAPTHAQNVLVLPAGEKSPPAKIGVLAWMAGRWTGEGLGGQVEENFSPAMGGIMVGHFRSSKDSKMEFFELETFVEENGSLVYRLKHFHPDLKGWEEKNQTVEFPLVAVEGDRFYFDGLTIERVSDDEMRHYVLVKGKDGKHSELVFNYRRVK